MATASTFLCEDQFLCPICLDVFTDPVSIPCGHNFCAKCITQHWNSNVQCQCPMRKKDFSSRPELHVNTFISGMTDKFKQTVKEASRSEKQQQGYQGDVVCDVCIETKLKALKSCLVCLTSYCETHLELHLRITGLKRHKLIDPVENLEDRICKKHDKPLEMFCKTDQVCVCQVCTETYHKSHVFLPLIEEYETRRADLAKTGSELERMIQERRLKIEQIKESVKLSKKDADIETAASVQVFTALIQSVERGLAQLIDTIEEKQKATERQAEGFIKELEKEISELMKRSSEVEQLSHDEDHFHFLQRYSSSLNTALPTKDWTDVRVHSSYEGTVTRAVAQLGETLSEEMKKPCADVELKRVQQFAVDVTLDPETANVCLLLSDDGKQVSHGDVEQNLPDSPNRFFCYSVVGKQSFSSGRFYFEVQVKEKTDWNLGVARESIVGKGPRTSTLKNDFWALCLRDESKYQTAVCIGDVSSASLSLKSQPQKVGVFVDYEEGLVSFYDVDVPALIYSFTGCNFSEGLYPYFNPCSNICGKNSTPLIICPVSHTD